MHDAAGRLADVLDPIALRDPEVPVIANVTARPFARAQIRELLVAQTTHPVRWTQVMAYLIEQGATRVVELGPGKTLARLFKTANGKLACTSSETGAHDAPAGRPA
jgi:malonyl CoA-acyl carrier protein transacylase